MVYEESIFKDRTCDMKFSRTLIGLLVTVAFAFAQQPNPTNAPQPTRTPSKAIGSKGMVVSGRLAASEAGTKMLNAGGNAADAGAATLLALSVLTVGAFCIGGEVPIMYYSAGTKNIKVLAGQGGAPLDPKAIEWYMANRIPGGGVAASAPVPSALDAIVTLLKTYGTKTFAEVVRSEEHTSELLSLAYLVCRLLLEKKKKYRSKTLIMIYHS